MPQLTLQPLKIAPSLAEEFDALHLPFADHLVTQPARSATASKP
jgi:hypothetical protein